ncbi:excinuclease ABC subunit B [compost metagenome]
MANLDYPREIRPHLLAVADRDEIPLAERIRQLEKAMKEAAKRLEFEEAAELRDKLRELRELQVYAG